MRAPVLAGPAAAAARARRATHVLPFAARECIAGLLIVGAALAAIYSGLLLGLAVAMGGAR